MLDNCKVLVHSAVRIAGSKILYFDPYNLKASYNDADIIFVTHNHHDHFSPEDIKRVEKNTTILVQPAFDYDSGESIAYTGARHIVMNPLDEITVEGIKITAVLAYTPGHDEYHAKEKNWLGYIVDMDGIRYYVTGDTYDVPEVRDVKCDVLFIPVGGTYTTTAREAATLANYIKPKYAVPTHYGCLVGSKADAELFLSLLDKNIIGLNLME